MPQLMPLFSPSFSPNSLAQTKAKSPLSTASQKSDNYPTSDYPVHDAKNNPNHPPPTLQNTPETSDDKTHKPVHRDFLPPPLPNSTNPTATPTDTKAHQFPPKPPAPNLPLTETETLIAPSPAAPTFPTLHSTPVAVGKSWEMPPASTHTAPPQIAHIAPPSFPANPPAEFAKRDTTALTAGDFSPYPESALFQLGLILPATAHLNLGDAQTSDE